MERVRSGLRVPPELNAYLIEAAQNYGTSKNALILQILREWVERNRKKDSEAS
jgi:predicted HicB family RNase H-like nuclease